MDALLPGRGGGPALFRPAPSPQDSTRLRLAFVAALVICLFLLMVTRLWFLQVVTGDRYAARAGDQAVRTIAVEAPRGDILDRDGQPIVDNRFAQVVSVRPDQLGETEEERAAVIADLADLLGLTPQQVQDRIDDVRAGPFSARPIAVDVPEDTIFYIHENRATRFPGVYAERLPLRDYPYGDLAAHVVGYTGEISAEQLTEAEYEGYGQGDIIGWAGVERTYEHVLQGIEGIRRVQVSARGEVIAELEDSVEAVPGSDVRLTLDLETQALVEEALEQGIFAARGTSDTGEGQGRGGLFNAPAGAALVLDVETGGVVAMASYPTFEPERFVGGVSHSYWGYLQDRANHFPLINRAISASYPPGSVYKIVTTAAALHYGFATPDSHIPCPADYEWNGSVYRNWRDVDSGSLNLTQALEQSCDTVYYFLARQMFNAEQNPEQAPATVQPVPDGGDGVFEYLAEMSRQFGLAATSGIDLPAERVGVVPGREWRRTYWENAREQYCLQRDLAAPGTYARELFSELCSEQGALWRGGDLVNMSIGQGDVQTTPLQVANLFAAVANRGTVMRPHVVAAVGGPGGTEQVTEPEVAFTVDVAPETLTYIETGLRMVTSPGGTAGAVFADLPLELAGKTGTAEQKPKQPFAWFGAYNVEPIEGRRYAVVAFVEEGGGGSQTAAPIVEQIFRGMVDGLEQTEIEVGDVVDG